LVLILTVTAAGCLATVSPASAVEYRTNSEIDWAPNDRVLAVEVTSDTVYIGGDFTSLRNVDTGQVVPRGRLAAFDRDTGALLGWAPDASNQVRTITALSDTIFVGGTFTRVNGATRIRVAAITTGGQVTDWRVPVNARVNDLEVIGDQLYIAGIFTEVGGQGHTGIARVSTSTPAEADGDWNPSASEVNGVTAAPNGNDLVLAGRFTSLNGANRRYLGSVRLDNGAVTGWAPAAECPACWHRGVVADSNSVYVAGAGPAGRLVRYNATTGARVWRSTANGDIQAVEVFDGIVYGGGHATRMGGQDRRFMAAVSAATGAVLPDLGLGLRDPNSGVWAIAAENDGLWVGGNFGHVGSTDQARIAGFPAL
jgi:hypothetical protein